MARTRNSALSAKTRRSRPATARTLRRRARQAEAEQAAAPSSARKTREPETLGQARVWQRKQNRYMLAGLCYDCACHAAWGHAEGWQDLPWNPCPACQPLVDQFDTPGPRGSKWRKCLTKLEYMDEETLGAWLEAHAPEEAA